MYASLSKTYVSRNATFDLSQDHFKNLVELPKKKVDKKLPKRYL